MLNDLPKGQAQVEEPRLEHNPVSNIGFFPCFFRDIVYCGKGHKFWKKSV